MPRSNHLLHRSSGFHNIGFFSCNLGQGAVHRVCQFLVSGTGGTTSSKIEQFLLFAVLPKLLTNQSYAQLTISLTIRHASPMIIHSRFNYFFAESVLELPNLHWMPKSIGL